MEDRTNLMSDALRLAGFSCASRDFIRPEDHAEWILRVVRELHRRTRDPLVIVS
jgi:hypothetical protein